MGASSNFICLDAPITNKQIATNPIIVLQSDGDTMVSTHMGNLDLPQLSKATQQFHILDTRTTNDINQS